MQSKSRNSEKKKKFLKELKLPEEVVKQLGWKVGDKIKIVSIDEKLHQMVIQKI